MTRSISAAASGVTGIAGSINTVADIIRATTGDTDEARRAAGALADMGAELQSLVTRFQYTSGG